MAPPCTLPVDDDTVAPAAAGRTDRRAPLAGARLLFMGAPNFGLALSIGVVTTVLPVLLHRYTDSSTIVGLIIGGEGVFAVALPVLVGALSDRTRTRIGGRLPYMLGATPLAVAALVLMPFVGSLWAICLLVAVFYVAYFTYYPPYNALYPDLVPPALAGRSQGGQAFWRGLGLAGSVVGGVLLVDVWHPLPFIVAGAAITASTAVFCMAVGRRIVGVQAGRRATDDAVDDASVDTLRVGLRLFRDDASLRNLLLANALWEMSLAALRSFVLLWLVTGIGLSYPKASLGIGVVAGVMVVSSLFVGQLGDRVGVHRTLEFAVVFYGIGLLIPGLTTNPWAVGAVMPFVATGGAIVNALPYGLLIEAVPGHSHGVAAGLFSVSRGVGVVAGPLCAGIVIDLLDPWYGSTHGYGAMWIIVAGAMLLSIPFLRRVQVDGRVDVIAPDVA
ncbi:MAG: permease [Thermoleophilia bacterium]|nr:permease [Thermoleophilia bacterium]